MTVAVAIRRAWSWTVCHPVAVALAVAISGGLLVLEGAVAALVTVCMWGWCVRALSLERHDAQLAAAMGMLRVRIDVAGRVIEWRGPGEELFGFSAEEMIGRDITSLMPVAVAEEHDGYVRRFAAKVRGPGGGSRVLGVSRLVNGRHRDGHEVPVILFVRAVRVDGQMVFEGVLHAVPQSGSAPPESDGDEVAPRMSWRWLRNLGHEVRTPMAAIQGHAEILIDRRSSEEEREASAHAVLANSRHLIDLLNDLLDHARLAAGMRASREDTVQVRELFAEVVAMVRANADHKNLDLQLEIEEHVPESVQIDALRVRQVMLNLLSNALKFTASGWVRVEVAARDVQGRRMLRIEVSDTGKGIASSFMPALFEPFQQEARTQEGLNGSGLGLSICRQLARLMGGELSLVDSVPGSGSRFRYEVPVRCGQASASSTNDVVVGREKLADVRILLVDDARDILLCTTKFLESAGAHVEAHEHPLFALQHVGDGVSGFDLALLDLMMPGMNGFELARQLRTRGFRGPILALSAVEDGSAIKQCQEAGIDGLLTKPVRRSDLVAAVHRTLEAVRIPQNDGRASEVCDAY